MMEVIYAAVLGVVSGLMSGAVMIGIWRTELKFLRRDVNKAHTRIDDHVRDYHLHAGRAL